MIEPSLKILMKISAGRYLVEGYISHKTHLQLTATSIFMYIVLFNPLKHPGQRPFRGGNREFEVKYVLEVK